MLYPNRICPFFMVFLLIIIYIPNLSDAQDKVGSVAMPFLKFINSPTAAAMGNCPINITEEQSALYNPGAIGLFYLSNNLSFSLPNSSNRIPGSPNGMFLKTFSIGGGTSLNQVYPKDISEFNLSLAFAYSKFRLVSKDVPVYDYSNPFDTLYTYDFCDLANYYSAAIGINYYIKAGFGVTSKIIQTDYPDNNIKAHAMDYGLLVELPIMNIFNMSRNSRTSSVNRINFDYTPSFAYVKANIGDDVSYPPADNYYPLAKFSRTGLAIYLAINVGNSSIISARLVQETEKNLVKETRDHNNYGEELGLFGAIYYRWGRAEYSNENQFYKTQGYSIKLKGIIQWLRTFKVLPSNRFTQDVIKHLNISFSFAKYVNEENGYNDNVKLNKLNISYSF